MGILAIDTSMAACSAAILPDAGSARLRRESPNPSSAEACDFSFVCPSASLFEEMAPVQRFESMTRGHAEALFPMVEAVMAEAKCGFHDLNAVAVTVGPGSFTGVRTGLAAARGFALAAKLPVIAATSLEVMAFGYVRKLSPDNVRGEFVVVHDARRDEVYAQCFDANGIALNDPEVLTVDDLVDRLSSSVTLAVGNGAQMLADAAAAQTRAIRAILPDLLPEAADLALLVATRPPSDRAAKPLYLRPPDAKPQIGKSFARVHE